jgi:hypothetical protein
MSFATRSIAAAILVLAACHDASAPVDPGAAPDLASRRDRTPTGAPTNLRATNVTWFSVSLAWNAPSNTSEVVGYRIRLMTGPGYMLSVPATPTSCTWTKNLAAGNEYSFLVSAVNSAGTESQFSNLLTVRTPPDRIAPSAPVVSAVDIGSTYLILSWSSTDDGPYLFYLCRRESGLPGNDEQRWRNSGGSSPSGPTRSPRKRATTGSTGRP